MVSRLVSRSLALALALVSVAAAAQAQQQAAAGGLDKYLGRWNYDQPDRRSMTNVIVIDLPGFSLQVPQIGDIVFSADAGGGIVGRTDQGCTWRFTGTPDSLALDPPNQFCHNPVRNLRYTIISWSVTVSGRHEHETIVATSHQPDGDFTGVLERGRRTRTDDGNRHSPASFLGTWTYDEPDPASRVNIRETTPDGGQTTVSAPERGQLTMTRDLGNRIGARTQDGCTWSLLVRGNTAKLDPPVQTCGRVTLLFWTIAGDGSALASTMTGIDEHGGRFEIGIGSLHTDR